MSSPIPTSSSSPGVVPDMACTNLQLSVFGKEQKIKLSNDLVVTTTEDAAPANFDLSQPIGDLGGTLINEGVECGFIPFLVCNPNLPSSTISWTNGFGIDDTSNTTGPLLSFEDSPYVYLCNPYILLYDHPELILDATKILLSADDYQNYYQEQDTRAFCEQVFLVVSGCGEGAVTTTAKPAVTGSTLMPAITTYAGTGREEGAAAETTKVGSTASSSSASTAASATAAATGAAGRTKIGAGLTGMKAVALLAGISAIGSLIVA